MHGTLVLSTQAQVVSVSRKRSRFQTQNNIESSIKRGRVVKSVRFAPFATQYEAATSIETWYTCKDLDSFKDNIKRDVLRLADLCNRKRLQDLDRSEYCPVGLEKYCCSAADQDHMKFLRTQCIKAVLDQQVIQREMGLSIPEHLRMVAQIFSTPNVEQAVARANKLCRRR